MTNYVHRMRAISFPLSFPHASRVCKCCSTIAIVISILIISSLRNVYACNQKNCTSIRISIDPLSALLSSAPQNFSRALFVPVILCFNCHSHCTNAINPWTFSLFAFRDVNKFNCSLHGRQSFTDDGYRT